MTFVFGFVAAAVLLPLASAFIKGWREYGKPGKQERRACRSETDPPPPEFFLGPQLRVVWPDGQQKADSS